MSPEEEFALNQAEGALGLLAGQERADAEELLGYCRSFFGGQQATLMETARIGRLVEVLARRSSSAMPFAALGRALLAALRGVASDKRALLAEFNNKLALLGL